MEKFPNAEITDPSVKNRLKNNANDRWSGENAEKQKEEMSKRISKMNKEKWKDPEYRERMTEVLTENNKIQLQDPKFRETLKLSPAKGWKNATPEQAKKRKDQFRINSMAQWTPERREEMSVKLTEMNKSGKIRYTTKTVEYNGDKLKSSWEFGFALYLVENDLEYKYEHETFSFEYNGKKHRYTPDFYVPSLDSYFEVKGWYKNKEEILFKKKVVEEQTGKPCIMVDKEYVDNNGIREYLNAAMKLIKKKNKG